MTASFLKAETVLVAVINQDFVWGGEQPFLMGDDEFLLTVPSVFVNPLYLLCGRPFIIP